MRALRPTKWLRLLNAAEGDMGYEEIRGNADVAEQIIRWYADSTGRFVKPS